MSEFSYSAVDRTGQKRSGSIQASDRRSAMSQVQSMGLRNVNVKEKNTKQNESLDTGSFISKFYYLDDNGSIQLKLGEDRPSTKELALFTKQFSIMIERGVPIIQTLEIIGEQQRSYDFRKVIKKVASDVENGRPLNAALSQHPKIFDSLFVTLIEAGEVSGQLDSILRQLTHYIERIAKLKAQIKKALTYPAAVVATSIGVIIFLLSVVVPQLAEQFSSAGNELPWITQLVIDASNFIAANATELIIGVVAVALLINYWRQTPAGNLFFDGTVLKLPVLGAIAQKIAVSRMCATMSTLIHAGVPILDTLNISASASGNQIIKELLLEVRESVSQGSTFSTPLSQSPMFPKMVVSMIAVGEQTGALDETLHKVNEIYEDEVDLSVAAMTSLIEPALLVFLGLSVGVILIAMYLPIWSMASNMG